MGKVTRKRFRKVLLPETALGPKAGAWADALHQVLSSWRAKELSDAEAASFYLLVSLQFWFPGDWLSGPDPLDAYPAPDSKCLDPWLTMDSRTQKKFEKIPSLAEMIHGYSFKAIRRDARSALTRWLRGEIDLRLTDGIPTPQEVLEAQVKGGRWVSALFRQSELATLVHDGRDALSFLLHDLGHAEKFFGAELHPKAQIGCYRLLQQALLAGKFDRLQAMDSEWEERLHYLIADLNSHPVHILSVFWGTARDVFRKSSTDSEFERWQTEVYELWGWHKPLQEAYVRVLKDKCEASASHINSYLSV